MCWMHILSGHWYFAGKHQNMQDIIGISGNICEKWAKSVISDIFIQANSRFQFQSVGHNNVDEHECCIH